ncbi:MAG: hypothetical protein ACOCV1_08020 [Bacillota bacterium]
MKYILVIGLGPAGLFLLRQFGKAGYKCFGITNKYEIGAASKYLMKSIVVNDLIFYKELEDILENYGSPRATFITSDYFLNLLQTKYDEYFNKLNIIGPSKKTVENVLNKNKLYSILGEEFVKFIKLYDTERIKKISLNEYPIAIKLKDKNITSDFNQIGKIKVLQNFSDTKNLINIILDSKINRHNLLVQKYLEGDNGNQFSFGGYAKDGKILMGIVVNQAKQYPQGVTAEATEIIGKTKEDITKIATKILSELKYTGFIEVEMKRYNELYYLLDINSRVWGWVSILGKKYSDFTKIIFENKVYEDNNQGKTFFWISPSRLIVARKNKLNIKSNTLKKILSKKYKVSFDVFALSDLKPSISSMVFSIKKILLKIFNKQRVKK